MEKLSEFADKLIQSIEKSIYDGLYGACRNQYECLFDSLNSRVGWASEKLAMPLKQWNSGAFATAKNIAENACIPIAGCIVVFVFCWELIHMMQDSNRMQNIKPENILLVLLKLCLCVLAVSKSFDIVMGIRDIGAFATRHVSSSTIGGFDPGLNLEDILPQVTDRYDFGMIMELASAWFVLFFAKIIVYICSAVVYVRVLLWFLEFIMYAVPASIPLATFGNKEWGQTGMNYVRKMLAVSFEGFFMLLAFAIYGGVLGTVISGTDFFDSVFMLLGSGFALIGIMLKAGTISASIFNAH